MKLDDILTMWQEDARINKVDLGETSERTPILHGKYLELLVQSKAKLKAAEQKQLRLLKDKFLYYNGKMDEEALKAKGWEPDPFNGLKILKGDMDYYYNSDPEIQAGESLIAYYKQMVDTLEEILGVIRWRHQTIKNILEWRRFESGA